MDINKKRIERLRQAMNENQVNAKELSKRTGLSESTISRILADQVVLCAIKKDFTRGGE